MRRCAISGPFFRCRYTEASFGKRDAWRGVQAQERPEVSSTRELASRVARAARRPGARRTLLLDLDGTLAPIARTPSQATVPPKTLEALRRLVKQGWTVAIVSGRPATEARRMVPVQGAKIFGGHGLEGTWSRPGSRRLNPDLRRRLAELARAARRLSSGTPGLLVEHKPTGLALHDRLLPRGRRASWHRRLDEWLERQDLRGLERIDGKCVTELRPAGAHKGQVVATLPARRDAPVPDASLVGMGDDRTDEDLFRALRGRGLAVRVGRPGVRSAARWRLTSPAAVQRFLAELARAGAGP